MWPFKTIYEWWSGKRRVDALPFDELQSLYAEDPQRAYREFIRRLHRLVFFAATAYLREVNPETSKEAIEGKVESIFQEFSPQFGSGDPQKILLRFADVIRNELNDATFSVMAPVYYLLLPVYHIADDRSRSLLAAALQEGKLDEVVEVLADRFNEPVAEIEKGLQKANAELGKVIRTEFEVEELRQLTEGYVSERWEP